ncbi:not available [Pontoporia blainvillei]|uniref:Not available n=1 Tax=Pontoporia blainvillei TaxID=48723 RepID=A0ABX0S212_PONBL|nr:not available [Pontoporia blainvillei]
MKASFKPPDDTDMTVNEARVVTPEEGQEDVICVVYRSTGSYWVMGLPKIIRDYRKVYQFATDNRISHSRSGLVPGDEVESWGILEPEGDTFSQKLELTWHSGAQEHVMPFPQERGTTWSSGESAESRATWAKAHQADSPYHLSCSIQQTRDDLPSPAQASEAPLRPAVKGQPARAASYRAISRPCSSWLGDKKGGGPGSTGSPRTRTQKGV